MIMLSNLEALPVPAGIAPVSGSGTRSRSTSVSDPAKTFDSILGNIGGQELVEVKKKKVVNKKTCVRHITRECQPSISC